MLIRYDERMKAEKEDIIITFFKTSCLKFWKNCFYEKNYIKNHLIYINWFSFHLNYCNKNSLNFKKYFLTKIRKIYYLFYCKSLISFIKDSILFDKKHLLGIVRVEGPRIWG